MKSPPIKALAATGAGGNSRAPIGRKALFAVWAFVPVIKGALFGYRIESFGAHALHDLMKLALFLGALLVPFEDFGHR